MEKIFVTLWILFGIYILVLVMIMADLWSGLRKAKNNGEMRTSYGYKRSGGEARPVLQCANRPHDSR